MKLRPFGKFAAAAFATLWLLSQVPAILADAPDNGLRPRIILECIENQSSYRPGDHVQLSVLIENLENRTYDAELFVILYMDGNFWFWPAWTPTPDWFDITLFPGYEMQYVILDFPVPEDIGEFSIWFWSMLWVEHTWLYWCDFHLAGGP